MGLPPLPSLLDSVALDSPRPRAGGQDAVPPGPRRLLAAGGALCTSTAGPLAKALQGEEPPRKTDNRNPLFPANPATPLIGNAA